MSDWQTVPLGDALELAYGKALPKTARSNGGSVPVYGSNGITGWHNESLVNDPTVIVGRKGSAGAVQYVDGPCFPIDTTYYVRPRGGFKFDARFVYYLLSHLDLSRLKTATGVPGLTREDAYRETISFPELREQRRIVDLLSRAEGILRLRREAQAKARAMIPALFLDKFGDPATNPKGWDAASLGDHVFIPSAVRMPDVVADAHHLCIGGDSIESCTGKLLTLPTVREIMPRSGKYWYEANDVLYSKIRPNLAKAALAPSDGFCSADMYPLRCKDTMQPRFLLALLLTRAFTEFATSESVRAQMPKLNRETLFGYRYPLPPMAVQTRFVQLAEQVESIERQQSEALKRSEAAFQALLSRAFSGDLSDAVPAEEAAVA